MKWPRQLSFVRHAESTYNAGREQLHRQPLYQQFLVEFDKNWQSPAAQELARQLNQSFNHHPSDDQRPLSPAGERQARQTGQDLMHKLEPPEVIFVSPYRRARQTLELMQESWSALKKIRVIEEERIREQEFGLRTLYADWRVFQSLQPDQGRLLRAQGQYWYRYPQGENLADVRQRHRHWATMLVREYGGQNVLAVTHQQSIIAFRANMERLSVDQTNSLGQHSAPHNCSLTIYRNQTDPDGREHFRLTEYNNHPV